MGEIDILAFGAHPDDVELTCAGLLIKMRRMGYRTGVVDLTRGELGTRGTPDTREAEAREASRIMGLNARENLGLPDGNVGPLLEYREKVVAVIRKYKPSMLVLPYWEEFHPDHQNASRLISESSYLAGLEKYWPEHKTVHRPRKLIYYLGRPGFDVRPTFIVDVSETFEECLKAIRCYKSQLFNEQSAERPTALSEKGLLERLSGIARYYGAQINVEFGEPYFCREIIAIDDPMEHFIKRAPKLY